MATDLDYDDAIGQQLRAFAEPIITVEPKGAWAGVEQRRRRHRTRRNVGATGIVVVTVLAAGVAMALVNGGDRKHVEVVTPPPTQPEDSPLLTILEPAVTAQLSVASPAPYATGAQIVVRLQQGDYKVEDTINTALQLCFPWRDGETCDPTVDATYLDTDEAGVAVYRLRIPGWVRTADGLRSCEQIGCRVEIRSDNGIRIGTPVLDIVSGPQPDSDARLLEARSDGVVRVALDGLTADDSWDQYMATHDRRPDDFRPGWTAVCAFTHQLSCDGFLEPTMPPFDGQPHEIEVQTNRMLHTPEGWVDCVEVTCALVVSRVINVVAMANDSTGSETEYAALVPYRLPDKTPAMKKATVMVDIPPNVRGGDEITVTITDLPSHVPPDRWEQLGVLGQCSADDLRLIDDCTYATHTTFERLRDGSLRARYPVRPCDDCYMAIQSGGKGYPELARSPRFRVDPPA